MTPFMELPWLAHRRYPDVDPELAIAFFESDRQRAGLGALDERRRRGKGIRNYKRYELAHDQVRYYLERYTPMRREYAKPRWEAINAGNAPINATVQVVVIPERNQCLCVPVSGWDFRDQRGRRMVAGALRDARKQLRQAIAPR